MVRLAALFIPGANGKPGWSVHGRPMVTHVQISMGRPWARPHQWFGRRENVWKNACSFIFQPCSEISSFGLTFPTVYKKKVQFHTIFFNTKLNICLLPASFRRRIRAAVIHTLVRLYYRETCLYYILLSCLYYGCSNSFVTEEKYVRAWECANIEICRPFTTWMLIRPGRNKFDFTLGLYMIFGGRTISSVALSNSS